MSKKPTALANIDVCSGSGWSNSPSAWFNWVNVTSATVTVSQNGSNTFPFVVPAGSNSVAVNPGTQSCQLIGTPGTYTYTSGPCPSLGNPKTVIIT